MGWDGFNIEAGVIVNEALIFGVWLTGEKAGQAVEGTLDLAKKEPKTCSGCILIILIRDWTTGCWSIRVLTDLLWMRWYPKKHDPEW